MSPLSLTYIVKIAVTILFWCLPLLVFPERTLEYLGFPEQTTYVFVRLLGWAYLALCVGYAFGLRDSLAGIRAPGPIWAGIVSNGGASVLLVIFGLSGAWSGWSGLIQIGLWASAAVTGVIAIALTAFGVFGEDPG